MEDIVPRVTSKRKLPEIDSVRQTHLAMAELIDAWRIVPRMIIFGYCYYVWDVTQWFMGLENPNTQQAALISTIIGVAGIVFGLYTNSGRKWDAFTFWNKPNINPPATKP